MLLPLSSNSNPILLPVQDAEFRYWQGFVGAQEAEDLYQWLVQHIPWRQDEITLFGKKVLQPRLVCWMADAGISIKYSGLVMAPTSWLAPVSDLKSRIEKTTGTTYNSVLINYYRHGQDSMGWHADNEPELGANPLIASISLGAEREFQLKQMEHGTLHKIILEHGSLLFMGQNSQKLYKHQLPKRPKVQAGRINLTFRKMYNS